MKYIQLTLEHRKEAVFVKANQIDYFHLVKWLDGHLKTKICVNGEALIVEENCKTILKMLKKLGATK